MSKQLFNDDFYCKKLKHKPEYLDISYALCPEGYERVRIPHDALIDDFNTFYEDHVIWYKKKMGIAPEKDKRYILYFEGVYMDATIYLNDQKIYRWVNGFTSFMVDITDYFNSAQDILYVGINYQNPNARWYAGPGINRDVYLLTLEKTHLIPDSVCIGTELREDKCWSVNVDVEINNAKSDTGVIFDIDELNLSKKVKVSFVNNTSDVCLITANFDIQNPSLWDADSPILYTMRISVYENGRQLDSACERFGFRNITLSSDKGLFVNGKHQKLKGVCLHADGGCLGTAFNMDCARRQLEIMKRMGVNAIRNSHNVQAPGFLDLCDELGFYVLGEAFDQWRLKKTEYDYARFFDEWYKKDIASWIRRDRNHPSIIMWSAGNEIYDTHVGEEGRKILKNIVDEIKKHDKYTHASITLCSNYMKWNNTQAAVDELRLVGYNYGESMYDEHHQKYPDWYIFGSETASVIHSRSVYHFPLSVVGLDEDDYQCSSLGNCSTSWGAPNIDFCLVTERNKSFSLGQFLWTGMDYLGEPTPYHTKNSYFGMTDTAGFPKDAYYVCQSEWTDPADNPMVHIFPYWDFNDGQIIDVRVCSNLSRVEVFLNGQSLGVRAIDHENGTSLCADYSIPYEKGVLKAVAYDEDGRIVATDYSSSFEDARELRLSCEEFEVSEGDEHFRFVEINAYDENGCFVSNAADRVNVRIDGPAVLEGLDNGNSADYESYKSSSRKLFGGKLLAVIRPLGIGGQVRIAASFDSEDISVRKISIKPEANWDTGIRTLTPQNPSLDIEAYICPDNAHINRLEWKVTNERGVNVKNAKVSIKDDSSKRITLEGLSDGDFILRCSHIESSGVATVISCLEFKCEGFGQRAKNPYEFISATLNDINSGNIGNGNERGISTSPSEDAYICFKDMDFGSNGADSITIPIFELASMPVDLELWLGLPNETSSTFLGSYRYDKKSIWNVYQEESFALPSVIRGIHEFSIVVKAHKVHIKGIIFNEISRAYHNLLASEADKIYGDSFNVAVDAVTDIGNNVFLLYNELDLGDGATRFVICGRTVLDQNTINLKFSNDKGEELERMIEFKKSLEYEEQSFIIDKVCGKYNLSFIFLPGSSFDFKYFRFEK